MLDVKEAAARANERLGAAGPGTSARIIGAIRKIRGIPPGSARWARLFPIDRFQSGAGTSLNMNVNDAIALVDRSLAPPLRPNDDINRSQSSNDTYPTAVRIAAIRGVHALLAETLRVEKELRSRVPVFSKIQKTGRTHLQDAVPMSLGDQWRSYARTLQKVRGLIAKAALALHEVPLGGTAVGTGTNAPPGFGRQALIELRRTTGIHALRAGVDGVELQSSHLDLVRLAQDLALLSVSLHRIGGDLRLQASGPLAGLGELSLEPLVPGSSIMPGKTNPSGIERMHQVCIETLGLAHQALWAEAMGQLELNVMLPGWGAELIEHLETLTRCLAFLRTRVLAGITPVTETLERHARQTEQRAALLAPRYGYQRVAGWVREARTEGIPFLEWLGKRHPEIKVSVGQEPKAQVPKRSGSVRRRRR